MSIKGVSRNAAVAVALLMSAGPVLGQNSSLEATYARANQLHDAALSSADFQSQAEFVAAVHQHGEVADSRLTSDPRAAECHRVQANLLYALGDYAGAQRSLDEAASVAVASGDFATVAFVYLEAASVANAAGEIARSIELAREAAFLARTDHLNAEQRQAIERRVAIMRS